MWGWCYSEGSSSPSVDEPRVPGEALRVRERGSGCGRRGEMVLLYTVSGWHMERLNGIFLFPRVNNLVFVSSQDLLWKYSL